MIWSVHIKCWYLLWSVSVIAIPIISHYPVLHTLSSTWIKAPGCKSIHSMSLKFLLQLSFVRNFISEVLLFTSKNHSSVVHYSSLQNLITRIVIGGPLLYVLGSINSRPGVLIAENINRKYFWLRKEPKKCRCCGWVCG